MRRWKVEYSKGHWIIFSGTKEHALFLAGEMKIKPLRVAEFLGWDWEDKSHIKPKTAEQMLKNISL